MTAAMPHVTAGGQITPPAAQGAFSAPPSISHAHRLRFAAEDAAKAPQTHLALQRLRRVIADISERRFLRDCRLSGIGRTFYAAAHGLALSGDEYEREQLAAMIRILSLSKFLNSQTPPEPPPKRRADLA